jgi:hypothetical protein
MGNPMIEGQNAALSVPASAFSGNMPEKYLALGIANAAMIRADATQRTGA